MCHISVWSVCPSDCLPLLFSNQSFPLCYSVWPYLSLVCLSAFSPYVPFSPGPFVHISIVLTDLFSPYQGLPGYFLCPLLFLVHFLLVFVICTPVSFPLCFLFQLVSRKLYIYSGNNIIGIKLELAWLSM